MFVNACKFDDDVIFYFDAAGNKYVASGGNLAWRLNNPGLLRSHSLLSLVHGSIGSCDGYAIFSSPAEGRKALVSWLNFKKYFYDSLKVIAKHYQKDFSGKFLDELVAFTKLSSQTKVKALSEQEFDRLVRAIEKLCGYSLIGDELFELLPKIVAKIEDGDKDFYLTGGDIVLPKDEAIQWILTHRLDAIVVHEQDKVYLRSRPHNCSQKIKVSAKHRDIKSDEEEIETLVRKVGEKKPGQCIWAFINGIDNTKEQALNSAKLISQYAGGEQVLSMPNDTINWAADLGICIALKAHSENPLVFRTVKFLRYLLEESRLGIPVIIFAHSQGAIYIQHALEFMDPDERFLLRIFTFGGGSLVDPKKCHPDSHNYASVADCVPHFGCPKLQSLALHRYYGLKDGLTEEQVMYQLAYEDAKLNLDSTDLNVIETYAKERERYYQQEFLKIRNITILDADLGKNWEHKFANDCYQNVVKAIVKKYKKL